MSKGLLDLSLSAQSRSRKKVEISCLADIGWLCVRDTSCEGFSKALTVGLTLLPRESMVKLRLSAMETEIGPCRVLVKLPPTVQSTVSRLPVELQAVVHNPYCAC